MTRLAGAPAAALPRPGNRYTRWALRLPLSDATGGYRAARAELIDRLPFDDVASQGYCFQVDWAWRAVRAGARVVEVPITFTERAFGRSKMSGSIVGEALVRVTAWGLRDRLADWLPGRVAPSRTGATPRRRAVERGPVGGPPPPGPRARRGRTVVGRRVRVRLAGLLALAEIVVFVLVANWIGVGATILLTLATSALGWVLLARQGTRALGELRERARTRQPAGRELGDAGLVAVGGLLMVLPGFLGDVRRAAVPAAGHPAAAAGAAGPAGARPAAGPACAGRCGSRSARDRRGVGAAEPDDGRRAPLVIEGEVVARTPTGARGSERARRRTSAPVEHGPPETQNGPGGIHRGRSRCVLGLSWRGYAGRAAPRGARRAPLRGPRRNGARAACPSGCAGA